MGSESDELLIEDSDESLLDLKEVVFSIFVQSLLQVIVLFLD